jgi:hypothetical protein
MPEFWAREERARRHEALRALDAYLRDVIPETHRLRQDEVERYVNRDFTDGWSFELEFSDGPRTLALLVSVDFPYHAPYIAVLDGSLSLHWPHVERDNVLCVLPSQSAVSSRDPVTVAERILGDACQLVEDCIQGHNTEDFKHEFLSYWSIAVDKSAPDFLSLVEPIGPGRVINEYQRITADFPPVVYGWVESHAAAGHAVAVFQQGACFQCGFTVAGKPHLEVTTWPDEAGAHQEPACGAFFTPYGPIELLPSHALIAELATDVILGRIATARHRVWIGRRSFVAATGGSWADVWCRLVGNPGDGGFLVDRIWDRNTACSVCVDARCA